ncbi:MAG TPA: HD domain-containing protein [Anaerolineales bacterium]|nr:HD domain-containing protein [Anaerolineales bacterium]
MVDKNGIAEQFESRFEQALVFANRVHAGQKRKYSGAPYIAHLLGVTALVLEDGGSEDEAIAAVLHDTAEDQGGEETIAQIQQKFGEKVAAIVRECSDTLENPKPPWKGRKLRHLEILQTAMPETIRVMLADKVYNARNLLHGLQDSGDDLWSSFKGGREGTLWYFHEMLTVFQKRHSGYLVHELERLVEAIEKIA